MLHSALVFLGYIHPTLAASGVKADCGLYQAVSPAVNGFAGNVMGLSSFAIPIVIILLVAAIFLATTSRLSGILKAVGVMVVLAILIVVAPAALGALNVGAC
jgi:hypothetical protein